jgi:hypothetical protein
MMRICMHMGMLNYKVRKGILGGLEKNETTGTC